MEVVVDPAQCPRPPGGSVVTIGAYDGVHTGHRRLIAEVRKLAADRDCASAIVTFDRHPALVVRPSSAPKLLTDLDTKLELLASTGLDYAVVVHFDEARAKETAGDFVRTVLVGCLAARVVVVGHDFHFGHNREGNVAFLERIGPELDFHVEGVALFDDGDGGAVSSTRIRSALESGDVETAAALLGRPHTLRGELLAPSGLQVPEVYAIPAPGTYAGWWRAGHGAERAVLITVAGYGQPLSVLPVDGESLVAPTGGGSVAFVGRAEGAAEAQRVLGLPTQ